MKSNNIRNGFIAGFVGTAILALFLIIKNAADFLPGLTAMDLVLVLSSLNPTAAAWVGHFVIGTVLWGGLFAFIYPHIPGSAAWLKGLLFGVAAWLVMMVAVMPTAGIGYFGMARGIIAPVSTLIVHAVFGAVLGIVYGALDRKQGSPSNDKERSH